MSNKAKICNTALATHIEQCFPRYTYTPLLIRRSLFEIAEPGPRPGLRKAIEDDIDARIDSAAERNKEPSEEELRASSRAFVQAGMKGLGERKKMKVQFDGDMVAELEGEIAGKLHARMLTERAAQRQKIVSSSDASLDIAQPAKALEARIGRTLESASLGEFRDAEFRPLQRYKVIEMEQLGLFFSESTCFRCEGLAYAPCGNESSLLPSESISETYSASSAGTATSSDSQTATSQTTTTDERTDTTTLVNSYDKTVRDTLDLKRSISGTVSGKLFDVLDVSLTSTASADFTRFVERISKSSSTVTQNLVHKVVNDFTLSQTRSRSDSLTLTEAIGRERSIENNTAEPIHIIERQPHCVYSVIQKRTDVHLAWSGCIDNTGEDLCRPDNLEEKKAGEIAAIEQKWAAAPAPSEFGPRPSNQAICTPTAREDSFGSLGADNVTFNANVQAAIPAGHGYVPGSAVVTVVDSQTGVTGTSVTSQPAAGASGLVTFGAQVVVDNKFSTKKEYAVFKVCFEVTTPAAADYDEKVGAWRDAQAQAEIDAFLAEESAKLEEFLLSDRIGPLIERKIFEKFFAADGTDECCKLIRRVRKIFDFDLMAFALLPTWNDFGSGCQSSDPVTIYTARCLTFYLPVRPGKESEALALLIAINVLQNDPQLLAQIGGYVNSINDMRANLFDRAFDPTGWDVTLDNPSGYQLTPYDNADGAWDTAYETSLNYQVIDVNVVTVPCGGPRKELRPNLC